MKAEDFIRFAEGLASAPAAKPAENRSAISRAYYGAYLLVRDELLRPMGIKLRSGGNEHLWTQRVLANCNVPEGFELASRLKNLQQLRTEADYDLHLAKCEGQKIAMTCVERAREIEKRIVTYKRSAIYSLLHSGITAYLKKINEL